MFITITAHELRSPMMPILGYVEHIAVLGRCPDSGYPEAVTIDLDRLDFLIREYIKRATTLLDIWRIVAGKLRAELSLVDLSGLVLQAAHRHQMDAERSGRQLEPNIEDDVSGLLDGLAIEQIADSTIAAVPRPLNSDCQCLSLPDQQDAPLSACHTDIDQIALQHRCRSASTN